MQIAEGHITMHEHLALVVIYPLSMNIAKCPLALAVATLSNYIYLADDFILDNALSITCKGSVCITNVGKRFH